MSSNIAEAKAALIPKSKPPITKDMYLSTGSTLLNVAMSRKFFGGVVKGQCFLFCGSSNSGKTWIAHSIMAEASINDNFSWYELIYDNIENGASMDKTLFFGARAAKRIRPPTTNKDGSPKYSSTVEELHDNIDDAYRSGDPFIYVVDSTDALSVEAELKKLEADKKVRRGKVKTSYDAEGNEVKEDKVKGTYGTDKAKVLNQLIRVTMPKLIKTGSILVLISQVRSNIGFGAQYKPLVRSGGHAPKFYSSTEVTSKVIKKLYKKVKGKDREIGTLCQMQIERSRDVGHGSVIELPIYFNIGIDNTGSCIRYLVDNRYWKGELNPPTKKEDGLVKSVTAPEFGYSGDGEGLVQLIENGNKERRLYKLVQKCWRDIENQCSLTRKNRYS